MSERPDITTRADCEQLVRAFYSRAFLDELLGPIFVELIQRKNHHSFGEGNFGALFRSIERDQEERGTL